MIISTEKLKIMTQEQIFAIILPIITQLQEEYNYLSFNEKIYFTLIESILKRSDGFSKMIDTTLIKEKAERMINQKIKQQIEAGLDNDIIVQYIEKNIKDKQDVQKNQKELLKLSQWLESLNIFLTPDFYKNLIETNATIRMMIRCCIEREDLTILPEEVLNLPLLTAYCQIYKISMKEFLNDKETTIESCDLIKKDRQLFTPDILKIYLNELSPILLTKEEEQELFYKMKNGDSKAKEELLEHNLRLVVSIAKYFTGKGVDLEDLIQAGNEGLLKAVEKYNATKGTRFSTYAVNWIQQSIRRTIADTGRSIRIPVHTYELLEKYKKTKTKLEIVKGREITNEEIAQELNIPVAKACQLDKLQENVISINTFMGEDKKYELGYFIPDKSIHLEEQIIHKEYILKVRKLLVDCNLTSKEMNVLILRYGIGERKPQTLEEIGKIYHVTRENIRKIEAQALKKIREYDSLEEFLIYMDNPSESLKRLEWYRQEYQKNPHTTKKLLKKRKNS